MLNNIVAITNDGITTPPNSYESIATAQGTGSSATITFSSIPSTYKHLQVRAIMRGTNASSLISLIGQVNDTNYTNMHSLYGIGSGTPGSYYSTTTVYNDIVSASSTASVYSAMVLDILDYQNTNKNKTFRNILAYDLNGSGQLEFQSHLWASTSAINKLTFTVGAGSFSTDTQFALYGIKG